MIIKLYVTDDVTKITQCRNYLSLNTQKGVIDVIDKPYKYISFTFNTEFLTGIKLYNDNNELILGVNTIERTYYNAIPTRLKTLSDFCNNLCKGLYKSNFKDDPDFI